MSLYLKKSEDEKSFILNCMDQFYNRSDDESLSPTSTLVCTVNMNYYKLRCSFACDIHVHCIHVYKIVSGINVLCFCTCIPTSLSLSSPPPSLTLSSLSPFSPLFPLSSSTLYMYRIPLQLQVQLLLVLAQELLLL